MHNAPDFVAPDFVVQIHSALAVRYGRRWLAMWAGLDMEMVRTDWRRVLREFADNPSAVMHALDHLPEAVPTATDFRTLCAAGPRPAFKALPLPAASAEGRAVMRGLLARLRAPVADVQPKAWADAIADRVAQGKPVSYAARVASTSVRGRIGRGEGQAE